jgi:O-methyltransferase
VSLSAVGAPTDTAALYLDLLKSCLTRSAFPDVYCPYEPDARRLKGRLYARLRRLLLARNLELVRRVEFDAHARGDGRDWPASAETMTGLRRLDHLQACIHDLVARDVPGDLIETGVWRGGTTIFMRAALEAYGDRERAVWAADSFQGLPEPDAERYPADAGDRLSTYRQLAVPLAEVRANFDRYGLLDERVRFLPGWFRDTLPKAPIERLALLRLDGDLYESTSVALRALYPKLSPGGYVIVDDYHAVPACRAAVDDFRREQGIDEELERVDWTCVAWRRTGP